MAPAVNPSLPEDSQFQPDMLGLVSRFSYRARMQMFKKLCELHPLSEDKLVLDIGVTAFDRFDSNFFEKKFPFPHKLTAVGIEDCKSLESTYPGLRFLKADATKLPFKPRSFDLAVSFAVIEHVGSREQQKKFIGEMLRVSNACFITTPNRWFPVEFHSLVPLLHWLPPKWFRSILKLIGKEHFSKEENLNLLDRSSLRDLFPPNVEVKFHAIRLFGFISNWVVYAKERK